MNVAIVFALNLDYIVVTKNKTLGSITIITQFPHSFYPII